MPNVFSKFAEINEYNNSFIYKIISLNDDFDEADTYYGSTIQSLRDRIDNHRSKYRTKNTSCYSKKIFDKYGLDNCYIELVENCNCEDKYELKIIEAFYINAYPCINNNIPTGINTKNLKEYGKEYYLQNMDDIKKYSKQYKILNKEDCKEQKRLYRLSHREEAKEKSRLYRLIYKDDPEFREKKKEQNRLYRLKKKQEKINK